MKWASNINGMWRSMQQLARFLPPYDHNEFRRKRNANDLVPRETKCQRQERVQKEARLEGQSALGRSKVIDPGEVDADLKRSPLPGRDKRKSLAWIHQPRGGSSARPASIWKYTVQYNACVASRTGRTSDKSNSVGKPSAWRLRERQGSS